MQCHFCKNKIERGDRLTCINCKDCYHYRCQDLTSADFRDNANRIKSTWKCQACISKARRQRNDSTPIRGSSTTCDESVDNAKAVLPETSSSGGDELSGTSIAGLDNTSISYKDFEKLLDQKLSKIEESLTRNIRNSIREEFNCAIEKLKQEFTQTTDFLAAEQADLRKDITITNDKIKHLEMENSKLSKELLVVGGRLKNLEKSSRSCNLEIQSVPEGKQENLLNVLRNLCRVVGADIADRDICSVRRVAKMNPSTNRPRNVLVTLTSERQRNDIISAFRSYNKTHKPEYFNSMHLGITGEKNKIYVVEHLSPETKELYAVTRRTAREQSYKYVWVKYGRIYARKTDDCAPIHITDKNCLLKLV